MVKVKAKVEGSVVATVAAENLSLDALTRNPRIEEKVDKEESPEVIYYYPPHPTTPHPLSLP